MQVNAADRKEIRRAEKRSKADDLERASVVTNLCATMAGRKFVWELLSDCNIFHALYPDMPNLGALLGERNVGLRVLALVMTHCPDNYLLMMREANERHHAESADAERSSGKSPGREPAESEPDPDYNPIHRDYPANGGRYPD